MQDINTVYNGEDTIAIQQTTDKKASVSSKYYLFSQRVVVIRLESKLKYNKIGS